MKDNYSVTNYLFILRLQHLNNNFHKMKMREKMGYSDKSNQNALSAPSCFVSSRKQ